MSGARGTAERAPDRIAVIGAGGHAKVVVATAQAAGFQVSGIYDDHDRKRGTKILGVEVVGAISSVPAEPAVLALGDNAARQALAQRLPCTWMTLVHPHAWLHDSVELGEGTVVFAGAVIQPDTVVGRHAIVNTSASLDHDCRIGDYVHVAPGVSLAGGVTIGEGALVGIGSSAIPETSVGAWATVGAGAAITADIPAHVTARGVPAKPASNDR